MHALKVSFRNATAPIRKQATIDLEPLCATSRTSPRCHLNSPAPCSCRWRHAHVVTRAFLHLRPYVLMLETNQQWSKRTSSRATCPQVHTMPAEQGRHHFLVPNGAIQCANLCECCFQAVPLVHRPGHVICFPLLWCCSAARSWMTWVLKTTRIFTTSHQAR